MVEKCTPSATLGLTDLFTEKVCFAFEGSTIVSTKSPFHARLAALFQRWFPKYPVPSAAVH